MMASSPEPTPASLSSDSRESSLPLKIALSHGSVKPSSLNKLSTGAHLLSWATLPSSSLTVIDSGSTLTVMSSSSSVLVLIDSFQ